MVFGVISRYDEPAKLQPGQLFHLRNILTNKGSTTANFRQIYYIEWEDKTLIATTITLNPFEEATGLLFNTTMPNLAEAVIYTELQRQTETGWVKDDSHTTKIIIGIGLPDVTIIGLTYPEEAYPSQIINMSAEAKNQGATSAYATIHIGTATPIWQIINANNTQRYDYAIRMPPLGDLSTTASLNVLHDGVWVTDDQREISVKRKEIPEPPPTTPNGGIPILPIIGAISVVAILWFLIERRA